MLEALIAQQSAAATAFTSVKDSLAAKGFGTTDEIGRAINSPRNFLKHASDNAFDASGADLQSIAIYEIILATTNLARFDKAIVPDVPRFVQWISVNRPDLEGRVVSTDALKRAGFHDEETVMNHKVTRFVHAGKYVAEVAIDRIPDDDAWGPYLSVEDALKIEAVEKALKAGDLDAAAKLARIYEMKPVAAEYRKSPWGNGRK